MVRYAMTTLALVLMLLIGACDETPVSTQIFVLDTLELTDATICVGTLDGDESEFSAINKILFIRTEEGDKHYHDFVVQGGHDIDILTIQTNVMILSSPVWSKDYPVYQEMEIGAKHGDGTEVYEYRFMCSSYNELIRIKTWMENHRDSPR